MLDVVEVIKKMSILINDPVFVYLKHTNNAEKAQSNTEIINDRFIEGSIESYSLDEPTPFEEQNKLEVEYQIKNRLVKCIENNATPIGISISRSTPPGTSKIEHYTDIIKQATSLINFELYKNTHKFVAHFYLISVDILPILFFTGNSWKRADIEKITSGPYLAGTYEGTPVFVCPTFAYGTVIGGVNSPNLEFASVVSYYNENGHNIKFEPKCINKNFIAKITIE